MYYIRPIAKDDLDILCHIARESGPGFTSLPANPELLESRINLSLEAFSSNSNQTTNHSYLFVLVEQSSGQVVGTCGIESAVGLNYPWYHYRLGTVVHASPQLQVYNQFQTLYLCNDYTGCSEVCTLFLLPEHRRHHNGALLSKSRFLFMAAEPARFSARVIAEMRGFSDDAGRSPFWDGLGQKFFSIDFSQADYLTGSGNKAFIAELMPKYTIYQHLLPESAQETIGRVHPATEPARAMLESEGFRFENYVDIFDAGPTLTAPLKKIRSIRQSRCARVSITDTGHSNLHAEYLLSNERIAEFRCTFAPARLRTGRVEISPVVAAMLNVSDQDLIRIVELK
ncbi:arginine N-succinyltransferase [Pontibacter sp. JAM-7]|uniref:arginine N-succinyltransferase n=1 Tax=Pontibacter sp. JAM-7 TaxID=3366581 RepID=UPI003AF6F801